jgi:hypothetical protein
MKIDTTIDPIDWMWFLTFFPSHHCPLLSNQEVDIINQSRVTGSNGKKMEEQE